MSASAMEKHLFNLKFAVKELERNSKRCEKEEKVEKAKTKKAIQKGNMEGARIHAENAIRQKNQALNYLRMSARVDAVASRVQTALTTRKVTNSMAGVVKAMDAAMKGMNLEKISGLMDKFESQFEDLDVQSSYMENAMSTTTTTTVPQGDVDQLMQQVADEAGLELNMELPQGIGSTAIGASTQASQEQEELTQRLAKLRQSE
ncbi:charged multivesicular body protein 1b-like [Ctenocephalides felis]|uniref:charged multivesicular body protein 1b-like n=1 Tax=Ctenocephalides felis TaxID=7515 RepID=UPI000E6E3335|nr:charged multivesicular body protein 1b-like [Ctenocephalides felis]XP_026473822.1 charged multivesicular body protein 1b-like [Ctenocephalides felis]XP_026473823.1 charged multivesicular body protein 1b-like [Ctenocephalides felis]XP_026483057.1 charged multivesicular body protein 1b-like [Ctenocephalides felis]